MQKRAIWNKPASKAILILPILALISCLAFAETAYAWHGVVYGKGKSVNSGETSLSTHVNGGYDLLGSMATVGSDMFVTAVSGSPAPIGTVFAQSQIIRGYYPGGFNTVENRVELGTLVFNPHPLDPSNPLRNTLHSGMEYSLANNIVQPIAGGDIGGAAFGQGSAGSTSYYPAFSSSYLNLVTWQVVTGTHTSGMWVASPGYGDDRLDARQANREITTEITWKPGAGNFVGADGRLYGVPYIDDHGDMIIPDMYRVELDDKSVGYISREDITAAAMNYATTREDLEEESTQILNMEASAFQQAFAEYYGLDALSFSAALTCVENLRYEHGKAFAAQAMQEDTNAALAEGINHGDVDRQRVSLNRATSDATPSESDTVHPDEVTITENDLDSIFEIATPQLEVTIPAYAEDGTTVIGEFSFTRL